MFNPFKKLFELSPEQENEAQLRILQDQEQKLVARRETIQQNSAPYRGVRGETGVDDMVTGNLTRSIEKVRKQIAELGGTPATEDDEEGDLAAVGSDAEGGKW